MDLKIEYVNISTIKPYERNTRKHAKEDISAIAKSIEDYGFNDPIGVWHDTIVEGHGRLLAAKQLGMDTVPIIRLDGLTDEQRRAYGIAHNRTAELSTWDSEALQAELLELDLDLGFDEIDVGIDRLEDYGETTKERSENILNLGLAQYAGVGKYDVPQLKPVYDLPEIREWIGFNYVLSDKDPEGKAVHYFLNDYQFERIWNQPDRYMEKLRQYAAVATPDFSPYSDMPLATQIFNHYRKHWIGAYMQEWGITVIPTIRASRDPRSLDFYLDGEPENGIVLISSMWTHDEESKEYFRTEFNTMKEKLNPSKIFVYGKPVEGMAGNIEYINTFTEGRWNNG